MLTAGGQGGGTGVGSGSGSFIQPKRKRRKIEVRGGGGQREESVLLFPLFRVCEKAGKVKGIPPPTAIESA